MRVSVSESSTIAMVVVAVVVVRVVVVRVVVVVEVGGGFSGQHVM
jgi:hypothetical protein